MYIHLFKIFETSEIYTEKEVNRMYPNSMFILADTNDPNNVNGALVAVSTSKESYKDICMKRKELVDKGIDCALLGSYNRSNTGVLTRYE